MAYVAVHGGRIGPVRLNGDDDEAVLLDQPMRNCGTSAVELGGAVAGLAQQHDPAVTKAVEQLPKCGIKSRERLGSLCNHLWQGLPTRVSGHVVGGRTSSVLGPALLAN